jgi:hypothetical protein
MAAEPAAGMTNTTAAASAATNTIIFFIVFLSVPLNLRERCGTHNSVG